MSDRGLTHLDPLGRARMVDVTPKEHFINWQQDPYGNYLARLAFPEKTKKLSVEVDLVAEMVVINPFDFFLDELVHLVEESGDLVAIDFELAGCPPAPDEIWRLLERFIPPTTRTAG